jgi:hypothetical protein
MLAQGEDKKFTVIPEHKPIADAITGLNRSLKAARQEAKTGKVDLTPLAEYGATPEEIVAGIQTKITAAAEAHKGGDAKALEKLRTEMAAASAAEIKKAQTRSEALQTQLYTLLVENSATAAIVELKGVPDLLLPFIKQQVKPVEADGQFIVQVVGADGEQRFSPVTGQPMTIKELVAEMKANEKYGRLFESEQPARGEGFKPNGARQAPVQRKTELSANDKIAQGITKRQGRR